jgi:hypothetical protein
MHPIADAIEAWGNQGHLLPGQLFIACGDASGGR